MKAYWYPKKDNVGDTLTPHIFNHFLPDVPVEYVPASTQGKVLGVGSIMRLIQPGDTIFGSGVISESDKLPNAAQCRFLAVRGPLTREILMKFGAVVPEIYGDPALLLPIMYHPEIKKTHAIGIVPHYVDKEFVLKKYAFASGFNKFIDVALPWESFVDEILSCEKIISSSLHGIIIAEAYGIPAEWAEYSERVIGKGFKFRDYLEGTGRKSQGPGEFPPIPDLPSIQKSLISAIHTLSTI